MQPAKVRRDQLIQLTDLPNIGPAMAGDYQLLGFTQVSQLAGVDAFWLYQQLCEKTGVRHDPCVIDVFLSVQDFLAGNEAKAWWHYTAERKARLAAMAG